MATLLHRGGLLLLFAVVVLSVFWWRTMLWTGQLRPVHPHFDGNCEMVALSSGSEDLVIDRKNRKVYISSSDFRSTTAEGSIWMMPVDAPQTAKPMQIPALDGIRFAPHGIDLWIDEAGRRFLFVIDHGGAPKHLIRKFEIAGDQLKLIRTFQNPLFYSPNDVAAISENQFYITNDSKHKPDSLVALLATLFRQKSGNVVWVDADQASIVADGFALANGIAVSNDGTQLYVSASIDQNLRIFGRNSKTGALQIQDKLNLASGLDNIDVAEDGSLWVGSHPRLFDFGAHAADATKRSPAQVLRLDPKIKKIEEIYLSNGDPLSGVSVAARIDDLLFLGAVFDPAVLVCSMKKEENT